MLRLAAFLIPACVAVAAASAETDPEGIKFFEAKVRPVLTAHCYKCHSDQAAKAGKLKGELRLDTRDGLRKGGESGLVIVPGKPKQSRLIEAIGYGNENFQMPPKDRLSAQIVADLEKWVAMGAPDPREAAPVVATAAKRVIDIDAGKKYWAFQPLAAAKPPEVKEKDLVRTPIDRFVLAKLEQKGITPNGPAPRAVLVRRAYLDLIGLPPTPKEVDAFVNDPSPDAWPKLIDKLLASDHYGERWGRHWLDIVRFAESNGYEFDGDRRGAYQYRDFVIRAFNRDLPYDQFIRWQLAGDKLLPGNYDASAATGFLVAGPSPGQLTAKTAEPIRYDQLDDMIATLGSSMLGLTIGCARCHDHKFDPLPQRDYYRMISCFADTDSTELKIDPKPEIYQQAMARWKAEHAPLEAAWNQFTKDHLTHRVEQWTREGFEAQTAPWHVLDMDQSEVAFSAKPARGKTSQKDVEKLKKLDDGSLLLADRVKQSTTFTLSAATHQKKITSLRVEALADKALPAKGPGIGANGQFLLTRIEVKATPMNGKGKPVVVKLKAIRASAQGKGTELALALGKDIRKGWGAALKGKDAAALFEFEKPVGFDGGTELTITLRFDSGLPFGRTRLSIATDAGGSPALQADSAPQAMAELAVLLAESRDEVTEQNRAEIARWMRIIDPVTAAAYASVAKHLDKEPVENFDNIFAAGVRGGRPVYFLGRGEPAKKNGLAPPGFIEVLMNAPEQDQRWTVKGEATASAARVPSNKPTTRPVEPRVAMAQWITDTSSGGGQLLARAMVNRLWMHHMGRGIVATPNDFGQQGDPPTHPELLDFLSHELIRNGWRLKPLQKQIMTSSVYMESGETPDASLTRDPENKLCWRHPSQRIEAEAVRDSLLAVSGSLDEKMYGPGTLDESNPRRSIYLTVKRSKPVLLMQIFDAPEAMQSIGQRQVTTVATQALTLMNSPFVRAKAEQLAKRVRPDAKVELGKAIEQAYRLAFCRSATDEEKARMTSFIERQARTYAKNGLDTAMADFCQVLLCSDEFVYVD
jgi:hypothetical protein